jgi:hypothetical protein
MSVEERIKEAKAREEIAQAAAASHRDVVIDPWHVTVACGMCEAMGMDPNNKTIDGDPTSNWEFMMPGAVAAIILCRPAETPEGDLFVVHAPNGMGFLMRISKDGVLWLREDLRPGQPLFTIKDPKTGDVTVHIGEPDLAAMPAASEERN